MQTAAAARTKPPTELTLAGPSSCLVRWLPTLDCVPVVKVRTAAGVKLACCSSLAGGCLRACDRTRRAAARADFGRPKQPHGASLALETVVRPF